MTDACIWVISTAIDESTNAVVRHLRARGASVERFDTERFPFETSLSVGFDEGETIEADVGEGPRSMAPTAVWYRRLRSPSPPAHMNAGVYAFCARESRSTLLGTVLSIQSRFMSRPESVWAAENKVFQLECARRIGLPIPRTLVSNSPARILAAFQRCNERMIIKPAKSGYVDYGTEQQAVYTNRLLADHLERIDSARLCPAIYQELLDKACDVRVTIVGDKAFVAEIDSQTDPAAEIDWRHTDDPNLPHRVGTLPAAIERGLHDLVRALGLTFGAIDLVRTKEGGWYFLEVNPNGQWLWLEDKLGFPISEEIASWLTQTQ